MAKFSLEEKKEIVALFDKCDIALLKVSEHEGVNHIDKVIIDGKDYNMPSEELGFRIRMSREAVNLIRQKGSILKLDKTERNFVIQFHPAWIMLRDGFDFNGEFDASLSGVILPSIKKPYTLWCKDFCDSVGDKRYYPQKNMGSLMVTYKEFTDILKSDKNRIGFSLKENMFIPFTKNVDPLYRGFFEAVRVKLEGKSNLKVELNKYGYPEVYYNQNDRWMRIDVSTEEGLKKLSEFSPSPFDDMKVLESKQKQLKKKRPTKKGKKRK